MHLDVDLIGGPFAAPDCTVPLVENVTDCVAGDLVRDGLDFRERGEEYTNRRIFRRVDGECIEDEDAASGIFVVSEPVAEDRFPRLRTSLLGLEAQRSWIVSDDGQPIVDRDPTSRGNFQLGGVECWAVAIEGTSDAVCIGGDSVFLPPRNQLFADALCNDPVHHGDPAVVAWERDDSRGGFALPEVDLYRRGAPYEGEVFGRNAAGICVRQTARPGPTFRLRPSDDYAGLTTFTIEGL